MTSGFDVGFEAERDESTRHRDGTDGWMSALRRAAVRATLAPSIHNTQPWRWSVRAHSGILYADDARRLRVLDPRGRQMLISCGCALMNARVALSVRNHAISVSRVPATDESNQVALIRPAEGPVETELAGLDPAIDERRTNRRRFSDDPVPATVVQALIEAARREDAALLPVVRPEHRMAVARLTRQADAIENADPAYRAELRAFGTHRQGWLATPAQPGLSQCLLLLGTGRDDPLAWVRAGEALERVLLLATAAGFAASPFTQLVEVARTRSELIDDLALQWFPHLLLRVGRAPTTPATRRRRLVDVVYPS